MPKKPPETLGIIYRMPLEDLHPHPLNPYGVRDDPAMQELMGSVKENGVLIPAIARPRKEGGYELISGHRRKYACEQLGQDTMPVMVLNLKDDDAIIRMIDSNIQRENILPSERAKAYRLKMEAVKRKAGRPQKGDEKIAENFGEFPERRFHRRSRGHQRRYHPQLHLPDQSDTAAYADGG